MKRVIGIEIKFPISVLMGYMKFMGDTIREVDSQFYEEFFEQAFNDIMKILTTSEKLSIHNDFSSLIDSTNLN